MSSSIDFSEHYKSISNTELLEILENQSSYQTSAIEAAKKELEKRQLTEEDIEDAKAPLVAKKVANENQALKLKTFEDKLKNSGNTFIDAVNPIQTGVANTNKSILAITLIFTAVFVYQLATNYKILSVIVSEIARLDIFSFFYILQFLILPIGAFVFWKRKTTGWILLLFYSCFSAVELIWMLIESFKWKVSSMSGIARLFPRPSPIVFALPLLFYVAILYILCKKDIRNVFEVSDQKLKASLAISTALAFLILFVSNK